jgi:endo-1,4-beta-xylanase
MLFPALFMTVLPAANSCGQPVLKEAFKKYFLVGTALNRAQIDGRDANALSIVEDQFNSVTPENILKWDFVHPGPDTYDFEPADRFVAFGEANGMFVVGHSLVWHHQTPRWVFKDENGKPADRETLLRRMRDHILRVVGRYRGRIGGWDVVNEAVDEDGKMRNSPWLQIIGADFVEKAFEYAHEADPRAELYYNDYTLYKPAKREGVIGLVKKLRDKGIRIDGVGFQGHYQLDNPKIEEIEASIQAFSGIGLKAMFTELDVDVLPSLWETGGADVAQNFKFQNGLNPYPTSLPDSVQKQLADRYAGLFALFVRYHEVVSRVTFWGVTDGDSWLNNWPVRGRTNYPLLFDRNSIPKPAFEAVIRTAEDMEKAGVENLQSR